MNKYSKGLLPVAIAITTACSSPEQKKVNDEKSKNLTNVLDTSLNDEHDDIRYPDLSVYILRHGDTYIPDDFFENGGGRSIQYDFENKEDTINYNISPEIQRIKSAVTALEIKKKRLSTALGVRGFQKSFRDDIRNEYNDLGRQILNKKEELITQLKEYNTR